jgi:hypothetical protein
VAIRSVRQLRAVAPKRAKELVDRGSEVGEALALREGAAQAPRVGEDADEHVGLAPPGRLLELEPVELELLTGLVRDLGDDRLTGAAAPAAGAQGELADLAHERRVGALEAEIPKLAVKHGREDVRIVGEAGLQVGAVGLERRGRAASLRLPARQVAADRLRVAAGVAGDRGDRPAASSQCVDLHVVLHRQHSLGALLGRRREHRDRCEGP